MIASTTDTLTAKIASSVQEKINVKADPLRNEALEAFQSLGMPSPKHEEYKHTPIARYLEKNFTFAPSAATPGLTDVSRFFIAGLDANVIVFIDGVYAKEHSSII